jgi:hypothetical protein
LNALTGANLTLRILLELCALAAVGYWGYSTASGAARWVLAAAAVAAVVAVWALFVAPKAKIEVGRPVRFAIELAVWAAAALGLIASGQVALGAIFAVVAVVSGTLNYVRPPLSNRQGR